MRQVSPGATHLCDIHDRVENLPPLITWWPTQPAPLWQILPNSYPFPVAYVAVVLLSVLHPKPCSKPFALVQAFSLTFFTGSQIRYLLLSAIPSAPRLSQKSGRMAIALAFHLADALFQTRPV